MHIPQRIIHGGNHRCRVSCLCSLPQPFSPEQHLSSTNPHWLPHVMFWFDKSLPSAAWGLSDANNTIIDATQGDPNSPVRLLFIPVRRWSHGKLAIPVGGK
jgi:hypothetical protein